MKILQAGANVDRVDLKGRTALHLVFPKPGGCRGGATAAQRQRYLAVRQRRPFAAGFGRVAGTRAAIDKEGASSFCVGRRAGFCR